MTLSALYYRNEPDDACIVTINKWEIELANNSHTDTGKINNQWRHRHYIPPKNLNGARPIDRKRKWRKLAIPYICAEGCVARVISGWKSLPSIGRARTSGLRSSELCYLDGLLLMRAGIKMSAFEDSGGKDESASDCSVHFFQIALLMLMWRGALKCWEIPAVQLLNIMRENASDRWEIKLFAGLLGGYIILCEMCSNNYRIVAR